jgi:hypothetical protein
LIKQSGPIQSALAQTRKLSVDCPLMIALVILVAKDQPITKPKFDEIPYIQLFRLVKKAAWTMSQ